MQAVAEVQLLQPSGHHEQVVPFFQRPGGHEVTAGGAVDAVWWGLVGEGEADAQHPGGATTPTGTMPLTVRTGRTRPYHMTRQIAARRARRRPCMWWQRSIRCSPWRCS